MSECEINVNLSPNYRALMTQLTYWSKINKLPFNATIELTPYCNLKCPMCYVRLDPAAAAKQGRIMTGGQWLEILRQARDLGLLLPTITGGEPFLHPDFWEIYNGITELGMLPTIYTNGCLIDEAVVEKLSANPPLNMKITIYGASNETYEKMCGVKNGFDKVCHAIELLQKAGIDFFCTSTIVRENQQDLEALYRFANEQHIRFFHTMGIADSARGASTDPMKSMIPILEKPWTLEALEKFKRPADERRPFAYCAGYECSFFITWHGHLQFCGFTPKPYVQLTEDTVFADAWQEMLRLNAAIPLPPECPTCEWREFCRRCPGNLAAASGDPGRVTPSYCQEAKGLYELYQKLKADSDASLTE